MLQFVGAETLFQARLVLLLVVPEAARPVGADGAAVHEAVAAFTTIPLTSALSTTVVKAIIIWPLEFAAALNCWTFALNSPPAAAKMSKFVSTWLPLIETLKVRCPDAVWAYSAKCRRTW